MNIHLGRKNIGWGTTHWALKVGVWWYEVEGASKNEKGAKQKILKSNGAKSLAGSLDMTYVGSTQKSYDEIDVWWKSWEARNPTYNMFKENCQTFCKDLANYLTNGKAKLPQMESGQVNRLLKPSAHASYSSKSAHAAASGQKGEIQHGFLRAGWAGPSAEAGVDIGRDGVGAMACASAGRVEASTYLVGAHLDLNANTGLNVSSSNLEVAVVGFGFKVGHDGVKLNTPVGGVGTECTVM